MQLQKASGKRAWIKMAFLRHCRYVASLCAMPYQQLFMGVTFGTLCTLLAAYQQGKNQPLHQ
jgi:hypothetical protein